MSSTFTQQLLLSCILVVINVGSRASYKTDNFLAAGFDQTMYRKTGLASTATQIDSRLSPGNITLLAGETAMLACKIYNLGNKSVSWLRHSTAIPQLIALNNESNSLDPRVRAMVGEEWSEFVLMIRAVLPRDSGQYECQVAGPSLSGEVSRVLLLTVIAPETTIDGGPDIYVGLHSTLSLVCRISSGGLPPAHIIWRKGHRMLSFLGGEGSLLELERDPAGRFLSRLTVERMERDSGDLYGCQPSPGPAAEVKVHVIREGTMLTVQNSSLTLAPGLLPLLLLLAPGLLPLLLRLLLRLTSRL